MAKMSETQRRYFINRVSDKIRDEIDVIKHKNSVKIAEASEKGYKKYLKEIGVDKMMSDLEKLEVSYNDLKGTLCKVCKGIDNTFWKGTSNFNHYGAFFQDQARKLADNQFSKTKEGSRIAQLEKTREEAEDYLYGLNSDSEIAIGLNKILNPSGVKFLEGGE